ncbi:uncharacterized protein LOC117195074 [Drosophila miranda]|uniref:uncharacterized protein LOC117195074 n=1 Tax=Drosophila miranda TaxID=7229 RepID=UPI00143F4EE1|nr:uncharacterized protein LOC117195074 [Drosophila miranda]
MADPKNEMGTEAGTAMDSESVLNDLRLLELITKYPFLYSKAAQPEQDSEYDEWAWNQISKEFNASYENLPLSAPFSADELQWRWNLLLPTMGTLSKAKGQIPFQLWSLVTEIERSLSTENLEPPRDLTSSTGSRVPRYLTQLSLDGPQYKPVQPKIAHTFAIPGPRPKTNLVISSVSGGQDLINVPTATVFIPIQAFTSNVVGPINPAPDVSTPLDINVIGAKKEPVECPPSVSPPLDIKTEVEVALAAIELAIEMENVRENNPEEAQEKSPEKNRTPVEKPDDATLNPNPRYIPIKSAKYYTKKLLVRVKRIDQDEYLVFIFRLLRMLDKLVTKQTNMRERE